MKRSYESLLPWHFSKYRQMLFLAGPRQVGKTTVSEAASALTDHFVYFTWDSQETRDLILAGEKTVAEAAQLFNIHSKLPIVVFDEIHKFAHWKNFLKGFFDLYKTKTHIIVTGSSRLDIFQKGGDSLMGRYFLYRMHPISVAEYLNPARLPTPQQEITQPKLIDDTIFQQLLTFGGFPEPFLIHDPQFSTVWKRTRQQQLFREDIRDLTHIQEINQLEILAEILKLQAGQLLNLSNLNQKVGASVNTVKRWLDVLETFYYCFLVRPYSSNITRSLLKGPKVFLWDWSQVADEGARNENFVASHLLKAVHLWTDLGLGEYELFFIRDKEKREVDFCVTKNGVPWMLVEVKSSDNHSVSEHLYRFAKQLNVAHAFQVVFNAKPVLVDCFSLQEPSIVPVQTLLSQLV